MRRLLKWVTVATVALLLIAAGVYLLIESSYIQHKIRTELIAGVETHFNARLTIGSISGDPLRGLTFHNLRLSSSSGAEVLAATRMRVSYSLLRLLLAPKEIPLRLDLDGFRLNVVRCADGRLNLQKLLKKPSARRLLRFDRVSLAGGTVRIRLEGTPRREYVLEHFFDGSASAVIVTGIAPDFDLRLPKATFTLAGERPLRVTRASATARITPARRLLKTALMIETRASRLSLRYETNDGGRTIKLAAQASPLAMAELSRFVPAVPPRGSLAGSLALEGPVRAAQAKLRLAMNGSRVECLGTLDPPARDAPQLTIKLARFNPEVVFSAAGKAGLNGNINAWLKVTSTPEGRRITARLDRSRMAGRELLGGRLKTLLAGGNLQIEAGEFAFPFGRLAASGVVSHLAGLGHGKLKARLTGTATALDLAALTGNNRLASHLDARFETSIDRLPARPVVVAGKVELAEGVFSTFMSHPLQAGSFQGSYSAGRLEVASLNLESPLLSLSASGTASAKGPDLTFSAHTEEPGRLARLIDPRWSEVSSGAVVAQGRLGGSWSTPGVTVDLQGSGMRYGSATVDSLRLSLEATNARDLGRAKSIRLQADGVALGKKQLKQVTLEGSLKDGRAQFTLAASLSDDHSLRVVGVGSAEAWTSTEMSLTEVRLRLPRLTIGNTSPLRLSISPQGIAVSHVALANADGTLKLKGGRNSLDALQLTLDVVHLPLAEWLPQGSSVTGFVGGRVNITGSAQVPLLRGILKLKDATLQREGGPAIPLKQARVSFEYGPSGLLFDAAITPRMSLVSATGTVPTRLSLWPFKFELGQSGLSVLIKAGKLDLAAVAAAISPKVAMSGFASTTVTASGNPHQPDFEGRAYISQGTLTAEGLPLKLKEIEGDLAFNRDHLSIEKLTVASDSGKAQIRGVLGLQRSMPLDLAVEARGFKVNLPGDGWARVNAYLTLTGSRLEPTIGGLVEVEEAKVLIPEKLIPSLHEVRVVDTPAEMERPAPQPEGLMSSLRRKVAVEVGLVADRGVRIMGRGLDAEFKLNMEAVKERDGSLRITGSADVIRGTYSLRNKRLTVEKAQALFTGSDTLNPELSARLTYESTQRTTIVIAVSGNLSKPEIQISSEPPMDQTSVYSYLFFGRPADKLGTGEGRVLQQQVAGLVGGAAAQELAGTLGQGLGLDVLEFTPTEGQLGAETITIGKYLTNDLFVTFERSFGVEQQNQILLNYRLSRWFSLESQFGSERTTGFDIFWNYDFCYLWE
ncbi:MAG: translocation/assembly module TamB domain-containing protein [Pseudomonadota bacterium]